MTTERDDGRATLDGTLVEVAIIGAGISGIGAAIKLREAGVTDLVVLEKADGVGGTWRENTYPGCACDVPSALYSYSFAPNPAWTRAFAGQHEILAYVQDVARDHGVLPHLRTGATVTDAIWDATDARWVVTTSRGTLRARVLVSAAGPWNAPSIPDIPGLDSFDGPRFHSSRWDHSVQLEGKAVAVVGTGASAVQLVPEVARRAARVDIFQRTPQWVLPKPDAPIPSLGRRAAAVPGAMTAQRAAQYAVLETLGLAVRNPSLLRGVELAARAHLRAGVRDRALRRLLRPDYRIGCKRVLFSNRWYPALARDNVHVHAGAVERVTPRSVVGAGGRHVPADVLVLATGFTMLEMPIADRVRRADGVTLADSWAGSPTAYRGTSVAGFPNLFLLLGPNLGTGHSSAFAILEAQVEHVVAAVTTLRDRAWSSVEPRGDVQAAYDARVQTALQGTVYNAGGCTSYYLDRNGRNSFSWPWSTARLQREVARFDEGDHLVVADRARTPA